MLTEFQNEPLIDFSQAAASESMDAALATVERSLGRSYPLIVGADRVTTGVTIQSLNPSQKDQVVGVVAHAGRPQAEQAMDAAQRAFEMWRWVGLEERARYLLR